MSLISNNKLYDLAKWTAMVFLPAINVFWVSVAPVWGVDENLVDNVSITLVGLNALLGALLGVSNAQYHKENK